ncbi:hypothetical protein [Cellulomonas sp. URHB0016]
MTGTKAGPWITGTVFAALVILIAAWFLGVSPQLSAAADNKEQAQAQTDANLQLESKIAVLATQFAKLDEYKAQLAAARLQIPTDAQLAAYQRELNQIASAHEVVIVNLSVNSSTEIKVAAPAAAAPVEGDAAAGGDAAAEPDPAAAADAAAAASLDVPGFYEVPVSLEVIGTYQNVLAFVQDAQAGTTRLLMVTGVNGASQGAAEASGGRPATAPGDLDVVLSGSLFALADQSAAPVAVDPAAPKAPLPVPPGDKNPMVPLP